MIWLLALLQLADWLTTRTILRNGRELNPLIRGLIRLTGSTDAVLLAKGAAVTGAGWLVLSLGYPVVLYALCALYGAVVAWNVRQMRR